MTIETTETLVVTREEIERFKNLDPEVKEEVFAQLPKFKETKYRTSIGLAAHTTEDSEDTYNIHVRYESFATPLKWIGYVVIWLTYGYCIGLLLNNTIQKIKNK